MKIKDLPQPYREMALIEQEEQGNKRDENLELVDDTEDGNFCWEDSLCGDDFWIDVDDENCPEITPEIKAKFPSVFKDEIEQCKCKVNRMIVRHEDKDWCNVCDKLVKAN
jgi:hypothetical protein